MGYKNSLFIVLCDGEDKLHDLLMKQQYEQLKIDKGTLVFDLNEEIGAINLPEGFTIHPLSEVYDFDQLNRLIWLGFHYNGDVPKISDDVQLSIKHAWLNYQKDYCSVVLDSNGDYASYCGFWYDEITQTAYLEPMVTAEPYHNMGLGRAVVKHSLQILKEKGCKKVFVDPDEEPYEYYKKIGFHGFENARFYQKIF